MSIRGTVLLRRLLMRGPMGSMDRLEDRVAGMPAAHRWTPESPERFEIMKEGLKRGWGMPEPGLMKLMAPTLMGIQTSMRSLRRRRIRQWVRNGLTR